MTNEPKTIENADDKALLDFIESQQEVSIRKTNDKYRIWTIPSSPRERSGETVRAAIKLSMLPVTRGKHD